ncbi:MAG: hypothetical protein VYE64_03985 [Planctomycetota bacterium]|nr:hypothetical protein [Planctomycetota bacterium]
MIQSRRLHQPAPWTCFLLFVLLISLPRLSVADSARELQLAVHHLTISLGTDSQAQQWRQELDLNQLETEAAKGDAADVQILAAVLKRFNVDQPELNTPAFLDVKYALQRQIQHLANGATGDIYDTLAKSRAKLAPISQAEIEYRRDRAVHDLQALKQHYEESLDEATRVQVFETLKPDELVAFLTQVKVEVPDFRTPEEIQQEIKSARQALKKIDEQLNSLNQQMGQVQQWLKKLRDKKSRQGDGPVPDDAKGGSKKARKKSQDQDPVTPESVDRDKLKLESSMKTLEEEKQALQKRIKQLQDDKQNLEPNEKARLQRRNQIGRAMSPYQRAFNTLQTDRRDIQFAKAQHSFSRFRRLFANGTDRQLKQSLDANYDTILKHLGDLSDPTNRVAQAEVGKALGELGDSNQAAQLIAAIRRNHSLPNVEISVSGELINQLGGRTISDTQPVRENILGRLILGEAEITGDVSIDLIPDPSQAHLSLRLLGNVESDTYTKQGRITAYAEGSSEVEARRSLFLNTSGLFVSDAYVAASLESRFKGVSSSCRLIQKFARKKYMKDKMLSESISASRLEKRMLNQFLDQTNEVLEEGQERIDQFQERRAQNVALLPEIFLNTTADHFYITGIKTSPYDLAAPVAPPETGDPTSAVSVRLNETALSNYGSQVVAGKAYWNYELADQLENLLNVDMANLREGENGDWQILFSDKRPIQFEFEKDRFAVVVTGLRFRQGQNTINYGLSIKLKFKLVGRDGKIYLERDGKAQVDYLTEEKDGKTVAFKTALERQLDKANDDGSAPEIELPKNLIPVDGDLLKEVPLARQLKLVQFRTDRGWMFLGWNYVPEGETYDGPVNTPAILKQ